QGGLERGAIIFCHAMTLYHASRKAHNAAMGATEGTPATAASVPRTARFRGFTSAVVNPLMRRIGGRVPGYGVLSHVGRRSGQQYRTPVKYFRRDSDYVIALMYGADADWLRNIEAAGTAGL